MKRKYNGMQALTKRILEHAGGELKYRLASASMSGCVDEVVRIAQEDVENLAEVVWQNCCSANVCRSLQARGIPLTDHTGLSLVVTDDEVSEYLQQGGMSPVNSISIIGKIFRDAGWKSRKMSELQACFLQWKASLSSALRTNANLPDDVIRSVEGYLV